MKAAIFAFSEGSLQACSLAAELGIGAHAIECRKFPDGERLVKVPAAAAAIDIAILYRSLDNPDAKLFEILLAASALRGNGAGAVILVAPYLPYMRQDKAFRPGEAISQRVIGSLVADHFDGLVTVDPHLHRITSLSEIIRGIPALAVSAAPAIVSALASRLAPDGILIGPDRESRQWVSDIAKRLGGEMLVGEKSRHGDRDVALSMPDIRCVEGRPTVIVDDLVSSGSTLLACTALLRDAGAKSVEVVATHCLARAADIASLRRAGVERISATDSVPGPAASIPLATILADALRAHFRLDEKSDG